MGRAAISSRLIVEYGSNLARRPTPRQFPSGLSSYGHGGSATMVAYGGDSPSQAVIRRASARGGGGPAGTRPSVPPLREYRHFPVPGAGAAERDAVGVPEPEPAQVVGKAAEPVAD